MVKSVSTVSPQLHGSPDSVFTLVFVAVLAALFIWHAFNGPRNDPREELRISVVLGITSLLVGLVSVFHPRAHFELFPILVGALYLLAAVYYAQAALKERHILHQSRAD